MTTKYIRNDNNYDSYLFIAGIDTKYTVLIQPKKCKYFLWLLITKIKFTILFGTAKEFFWLRKTNLTRKRNFPIKYAKIYSFNHKLWGIKFAFFSAVAIILLSIALSDSLYKLKKNSTIGPQDWKRYVQMFMNWVRALTKWICPILSSLSLSWHSFTLATFSCDFVFFSRYNTGTLLLFPLDLNHKQRLLPPGLFKHTTNVRKFRNFFVRHLWQ